MAWAHLTGKLADPKESGARSPVPAPATHEHKLLAITQLLFTQTLLLFFRRPHFPSSQCEHRNETKHRTFHWIRSASLLIINVPADGLLSAEEEMKDWKFQSETFSRMYAPLSQTVTRMSRHVSIAQPELYIPFSTSRQTDKQASRTD